MLAYCLVRLAGFEPATLGLEGRCSIRVSYRRRILNLFNINLLLLTDHISIVTLYIFGRGREIRTPDILLPKQARYQTALYPDTL